MSDQELTGDQMNCKRRESRYKTNEEGALKCETTVAQDPLRRGTVIDLSTSGIRLLCEGQFEVGQEIFAELATDRSHGIYRGVVRRIEPWVGGQSVLGCSLREPIPESVLQALANEDIVNRRSGDRRGLDESAKVSWPLEQGEFDVELKDFSDGGMKIESSVPIPDNVRLRFRMDIDGEEIVVEAKSMWKQEADDVCVAGVAFTHRDAPGKIAQVFALIQEANNTAEKWNGILRPLWCLACVLAISYFVVATQ
jgi:hypothetical protein